jgi:2-polyprenyl-3-methyl-5-hydroxy-6-metoxy-1,4-benzoquinol methylase
MEKLTECLACNSKNFKSYIQTSAMMHEYSSNEKFNFDRCEDCGLVFLNERVPESELGKYYTSKYLPYRIEEAWGKYASFVKRDQKNIDKARVRRVKDYHSLDLESRILDLGCGKPTFLAELYKESPSQLIGLDFSDEGWKNDLPKYHGLDLRKGEIQDIKNEHPFDVMTMWHYLEHDYSPQLHLKELLPLTHSETRLIVEVPNFDSYTRKKFGENWAGFHTPRHTALYSPNNIETLMKNSGWEVEKILSYGTLDPYTLHWMSKMEEQKIDWTSSMEPRFIGYVAGKVLNIPIYFLEKWFSMGFMTVIAKPR